MVAEAFEHIAAEGQECSPIVFVCDHASNALPENYGTLGLPSSSFETHISFDIGAAQVTRVLAAAFHAPAILARWSRLLIDLNRGPDDPTLVMKLSDGSLISGNASVDAAEIKRRIERYHAPYHAAIAAHIADLNSRDIVPVLISVHSFTPAWKGKDRPWQFGILWDQDDRLARPLTAALRAEGYNVGENEPYSGELENDTLYRHGTSQGLPHVLIEIRQDLVARMPQAIHLGECLKPILKRAIAEMGKPAVRFTRPLQARGKAMDDATRKDLESAVFRRLVAHLRERKDVQNIDLMIVGGFCRNCLGDWYREAAAEKGIALEKGEAREIVYGMPQAEWKKRHQKEATAEQQAAFERSQTIHK